MRYRITLPRRVKKVKTKNGREVLRRLEEYLENNCDEPIEILCGFWKDQQDAITYQEIRQAVLDGAISQQTIDLWMQDYSILVANSLSSMWTNAIAAGSKGQPIFDGLTLEFNTQAPGILSWLRERGAEFVTNSTQEQKEAISALLTKKMREGHTVDELSRLIRPCIGLTEGDAKAVTRFYDNIVATLKKEHPRMKPESIRRKALDATHKYAERKHRQRAMTIAQTESAFAYNRGTDEGIRQAQAEGCLGVVKKRWSTSGDAAVCEICASLEGMEIGMDESFDFKGKVLFRGHKMLPPAHPRCACAIEYIEVEKAVNYVYDTDYNIKAENDNSSNTPIHNAPKYIGSLDDMSDDMIKSTLKSYEDEIVNSDIENAVVVSKSGLVWKCFGNKSAVFPDVDLGDELYGAWVTHNHPLEETPFTFSKEDLQLFIKYNLSVLRGCDKKYTYEFTRNPLNIDELPEDWMNFENFEHGRMIEFAKNYGIGYRRWKNE